MFGLESGISVTLRKVLFFELWWYRRNGGLTAEDMQSRSIIIGMDIFAYRQLAREGGRERKRVGTDDS